MCHWCCYSLYYYYYYCCSCCCLDYMFCVNWGYLPDRVRSSLWMRERLADSISGLGLSRAWRHHTMGLKVFCRGLLSLASYSLEKQQQNTQLDSVNCMFCKAIQTYTYTVTVMSSLSNGDRPWLTAHASYVVWPSSAQRKWDCGDKSVWTEFSPQKLQCQWQTELTDTENYYLF